MSYTLPERHALLDRLYILETNLGITHVPTIKLATNKLDLLCNELAGMVDRTVEVTEDDYTCVNCGRGC